MNQRWGREESAGDWPSDRSVWTIVAFFVALASVGAICAYLYAREWTPLQKHYLSAYLATDAGALRKDGRYTLLAVVTRKDSRLAIDPDVEPMSLRIIRACQPKDVSSARKLRDPMGRVADS